MADRGYCANESHGVCNWLAHEVAPGSLCIACGLNRTIPSLDQPENLRAWGEIERAKKRLLYALLKMGLSTDGRQSGGHPLVFDFLLDAPTGHLNGVITIDIKEANPLERVRQRQAFEEPYRALLGHMRHETGHYFWPGLVAERCLEEFRALFGDERASYEEALKRHHAQGPPPDWQQRYVTAYASAHPWEDWAESWAHYLHMLAVLDTAVAAGMARLRRGWSLTSRDVYDEDDYEVLSKRWVALTIALNNLSRAMGHEDFYPFVISQPAHAKLRFVHRAVRGARLGR